MSQNHDAARQRDPWGSITKVGNRYRVRYVDNAGNRRSSGTLATYEDAWFERARLAVLFREGKLMPKDVEGPEAKAKAIAAGSRTFMTVLEWCDEAKPLRKKELALSSQANEKSYVKHIVGGLGKVALADLTPEAVQEWYNGLGETTGGPNRRNIYLCFSAHMRLAVEAGLIPVSPAKVKGAWKRVSPKRKRRTPQEALAIIAELDEDLRVLALLSADCHLRPGEARGLNRGDYDPATGVLNVVRKDIYLGPRRLEAPKRGSVGPVGVSRKMQERLKAHLASLAPGGNDDPMFPGVRVDRVSIGHITKAWGRAREAVGDPTWHMHDLRGVGLTALDEQGTPRKDLRARSRHKTEAALDSYLLTDDRRAAEVTETWGWLPTAESRVNGDAGEPVPA